MTFGRLEAHYAGMSGGREERVELQAVTSQLLRMVRLVPQTRRPGTVPMVPSNAICWCQSLRGSNLARE